jgi:hypothetical protein
MCSFYSGNTIKVALSYASTDTLRRLYYAFTSGLPTVKPGWLWDTTSAPRHSLLTPVTSYVGVFLLKGPPVIDGP